MKAKTIIVHGNPSKNDPREKEDRSINRLLEEGYYIQHFSAYSGWDGPDYGQGPGYFAVMALKRDHFEEAPMQTGKQEEKGWLMSDEIRG